MTGEQIIQRAIATSKTLRLISRRPVQNVVTAACRDGANAIEALVGLLRQKEAARGDSSTESGKE